MHVFVSRRGGICATWVLRPSKSARGYLFIPQYSHATAISDHAVRRALALLLAASGLNPIGCWKATMTFDYGLPAELFMGKRKGGPRQRLGYRRFATAAEAIRFAVEEFPAVGALGAWMQVGDERFDSDDIHRLYDRGDYPLSRSRKSLSDAGS